MEPDGGMDGGGGGGGSIAALCADFEAALCDYYFRCGYIQNKANCAAVLGFGEGDCAAEEQAAINDGRAKLNSSAGQACMTFFSTTASCDAFDFEQNADCAATFQGTVATSGSCFTNEECAPSDYCSDSSAACPGQCIPRKAAGQMATESGECQAGLTLYNGKCSVRVPAGGNCGPISPSTNTQDCAVGNYCNSNNLVCEQKKVQGETCSESAECGGGLRCGNGTCGPYVSSGGTCSFQTSLFCKLDLSCDLSSFAAPGTCVDRKATGGACLFDFDCKPDLYCEGENTGMNPPTKGTCIAQKAPGATCTDSAECANGVCRNNVCVAKLQRGAACTAADACAGSMACHSGKCEVDACVDPTP